jgi:hypothetical protein
MVIEVRFREEGDAEDAGITVHAPFTHPQLPAPQSSGPSQPLVHIRLQGRFTASAVQRDGWQHSAGTQSASLVHSAGGTGGDAAIAGIVGDTEVFPPGSGGWVVHPAREIIVIQIRRSVITFGSIQKPWLQELINKR